MVKYICEFIGTFFLVLTVGMVAVMPQLAGFIGAIAIGSALAAFVYAGAHISGGHYNPAVTLACYMKGKMTNKDLLMYWIAQFLACIVAAFATMYLRGSAEISFKYMSIGPAFLAELLFTFALCYVVLNCCNKEHKGNSYYGLAIGLVIIAGAYAVGPISCGAFNPAVALGITIMQVSTWSNLWIFIVANMAAGALAGYVYMKMEKAR